MGQSVKDLDADTAVADTHANVHLCCSPQQECRIVSVFRDLFDLDHAHDRTDDCEQAKQENDYQTQSPPPIHVQIGE
jgi:hypothetical protein